MFDYFSFGLSLSLHDVHTLLLFYIVLCFCSQTVAGKYCENQATEVARQCRQNGYSTVGDRKLFEAICQAVEARGNPGGLNALKQITSMNQQYGKG